MIGRLAVDRAHQGRGLGETLLLDAIHRVVSASRAIAVYAVVVEAKDARAQASYERYGFRALTAAPAHARDLALALAMSVEVRLGTEDHSPLSYLAKPLTDYFARSMREE